MPLRSNIDRRGRLVRLAAGVALGALALALGLRPGGGWLRLETLAPGAASLFVLFEAAAGWCAARACGLRTPF